jgi:glycosyltransferase involved in cell wall biosynthesis
LAGTRGGDRLVGNPYFSVIIPVFNRKVYLHRSIRSVLEQEFTDFELIVVDDGSIDNSGSVVLDFADARASLVRHSTNQGVCPARNTGIKRAQGLWLVFLDSDDEFVPGALSRLEKLTRERPVDVQRIASMYRWDDGSLSPDPQPRWQLLDYEGYIRWAAAAKRSDVHNCILRETFDRVMFPESRAYELEYHMDFAQLYRTWLVPKVVGLEHQDAPNNERNLATWARAQRLLQGARDREESMRRVLRAHGPALRRTAPDYYRVLSRTTVLFSLLAGQRGAGVRSARGYIREHGPDSKVLTACVAAMVAPRLLALLQALRGR